MAGWWPRTSGCGWKPHWAGVTDLGFDFCCAESWKWSVIMVFWKVILIVNQSTSKKRLYSERHERQIGQAPLRCEDSIKCGTGMELRGQKSRSSFRAGKAQRGHITSLSVGSRAGPEPRSQKSWLMVLFLPKLSFRVDRAHWSSTTVYKSTKREVTEKLDHCLPGT